MADKEEQHTGYVNVYKQDWYRKYNVSFVTRKIKYHIEIDYHPHNGSEMEDLIIDDVKWDDPVRQFSGGIYKTRSEAQEQGYINIRESFEKFKDYSDKINEEFNNFLKDA